MAKKNSGQGMFDALTNDETWILASKLTSGAETVARVAGGDHDTCMEIFDVAGDVQANWKKNRK